MPPIAPWARYDPRIRLVIAGQEMPCIRCNVDFELNAIPQAAATIAIGRDTTGQPSPAHALVEDFVARAPAQIYITPYAKGVAANSAVPPGALGLPEDEVRIFDGFVTGAGFSRSRGNAQFTIQMEHWLSELGFSSIFSESSHPANLGQYSFGALGPMGDAGANFSDLSLAHAYVTDDTIRTDFWGQALKPFLLNLCALDAFWAADEDLAGEGANDGAKAALERFNIKLQQPLAVALESDLDVANGIMTHVSTAVGQPGLLAQQTLWDVLVGTLGSSYLFYIVPRVEDAIVAAFTPGYRTNFATIYADQETQIEWIRGLGRPLRGVGILCGTESATGATRTGQGAPPQLGIGGYWAPDPDAKTGMIVIKQGPSWLSRLFAPSRAAAKSSGAAGNTIGTAVQPGGPKGPSVADAVKARLTDVVKPFLVRYAQAQYALEKLRTRQAVCSGPFRLDIAPGSTVLVESQGELFVADDPFAAPFYAHVARVSIAVDGEQPMIGTSFHLSHIRSKAENEDDRTSIAGHPLYTETFSGCPLVDPPEVAP